MTRKGKTQEPPLFLDMTFGEAMERFAQTDPKEVADSINRAKKKKPPGNAPGGKEEVSKVKPSRHRERKRQDGA